MLGYVPSFFSTEQGPVESAWEFSPNVDSSFGFSVDFDVDSVLELNVDSFLVDSELEFSMDSDFGFILDFDKDPIFELCVDFKSVDSKL